MSDEVEAPVRIPSPEEIMAAKGENGYWPVEKLKEWGIPLPPPARWRETLERRYWENNVPDEVRELLGPGYDEEGVQIAWRSKWRGLGRAWRMFEQWWQDPDVVRAALARPVDDTTLRHPRGGVVVLRPSELSVTKATLRVLEDIGWVIDP